MKQLITEGASGSVRQDMQLWSETHLRPPQWPLATMTEELAAGRAAQELARLSELGSTHVRHSELPSTSVYLESPQASHLDWAGVEVKKPGVQSVHSLFPKEAAVVPGAHARHS